LVSSKTRQDGSRESFRSLLFFYSVLPPPPAPHFNSSPTFRVSSIFILPSPFFVPPSNTKHVFFTPFPPCHSTPVSSHTHTHRQTHTHTHQHTFYSIASRMYQYGGSAYPTSTSTARASVLSVFSTTKFILSFLLFL